VITVLAQARGKELVVCQHFANKLLDTQWYKGALPDTKSGLTPDQIGRYAI
jgi:hypothetical protein